MTFRTYSAYLPGENAPVEVYRKDEVDRYIGKLRAENDSLAHLYGEAMASAGRYRRAMWRGIRNWARVMCAINRYLRQARNGWEKVWDRCDKELEG